jgi:ankyrin repeat protein
MTWLSHSVYRERWTCSTLALLGLLGLLAACQSAGGPPAQQRSPVDDVDRRIWFAAAEEGDAQLLQALIEAGIDPFIEQAGLTALHIAAQNGHVDAATVLIGAGTTVDAGPDAREAALADAAGHGNQNMVELIAGRKLEPATVAALSNLRTPLNLAVQNGHGDMVTLLLAAGADVNAAGEWYSPLHSAVVYGDAAIVATLLDHGASLQTRVRIHDRARFSGFRYVGPVELAELIGRNDLADLLRGRGGRD